MLSLSRALLLSALPLVAAFAQTKPDQQINPVHITGRVVDECADPIFRATVTLKPAGAAAIVATVKTDNEGVFGFPPIAPGVYELRLEAPGAQPIVKTIDASNEHIEMDAIHMPLGRVLCENGPALRYQPSPPPQSLTETALCQIVQQPDRYNGTLVTVRAPVKIAFEDFELSASACDSKKIDAIWLEYGKGPKHQPTTWCCGNIVPGDSLAVVQNDEFRKFHRHLTAQKRTKGCYEGQCYLYEVTATLTGRFDSVPTQPCPDHEHLCCSKAGFGHFGAFCGRLVIQSVEGVAAKPTVRRTDK